MKVSRPWVPVVAVMATTVALSACSGGSSTGTASGSGSGGNLDVFLSAQPNYPAQFKQWSADVEQKFKAATGGNLTIETFNSASDETTKIQASIVSGTGPDVYSSVRRSPRSPTAPRASAP